MKWKRKCCKRQQIEINTYILRLKCKYFPRKAKSYKMGKYFEENIIYL